MVDLDTILAGLSDAFTLWNLCFVIFGVVLGQLVAAIPGIGPVMAIAIAIPFTFGLDPLPAIAFLVGVCKGGTVGGAIPAILINTPGTPDSAATAGPMSASTEFSGIRKTFKVLPPCEAVTSNLPVLSNANAEMGDDRCAVNRSRTGKPVSSRPEGCKLSSTTTPAEPGRGTS